MYLFLMAGLPLGFVFLMLKAYPRSEYGMTRRIFSRGVASFIPIWLVARLLGLLVPPLFGSFLLSFHEWADRILPYSALPAFAYLVFYRPGEVLPPGVGRRRLVTFYAGALSPVGLCETMRIWGKPSPYVLLLLPFLLAAICLLMPIVFEAVYRGFGFGLGITIAAAAAATFAASTGPFLFLARLWLLGLVLVAGMGAASYFFAYPEIQRQPPPLLDE
jgi:hypothetical protein